MCPSLTGDVRIRIKSQSCGYLKAPRGGPILVVSFDIRRVAQRWVEHVTTLRHLCEE
jgi:hypothetical protein